VLEAPNTTVRPRVYRPWGPGVFPPALSSPVMTILSPSGRGQGHVTS